MDHPRRNTVPKERHALNSTSVLQVLARLVPIIVRSWAEREVKKDGGRYAIAASILNIFAFVRMESPRSIGSRPGDTTQCFDR